MVVEENIHHSNRTEFIPSENVNGSDEYKIEYQRKGGCFVTTKTAWFFVFLAISSIVLAVVLMYFYAPKAKNQNQQKDSKDLEKLLLEAKTDSFESKPIEFSTELRGLHYKLQIHPTLEGSFTGIADILFFCSSKTKAIILSADDLHINQKTIKLTQKINKDLRVDVENQRYDTNFTYKISLTSLLETNTNYTLHVEFSGNISDDFKGLYKTKYNKNHWMIATNLQHQNVKRVFPFLNEQSSRATFEISVARRTNMVAISNMPLAESTPLSNNTGWVVDHFQTSPPMPVSSVAFVVCNCESKVVNHTSVGAITSLWTNGKEEAAFALESAGKIMKFFEDYFDFKFPLPKIDFVVVPNLAETALNSWGLVFFRDSSLLLEDKTLQHHVFQEIALQFSYQWFGDLVSMNATTNDYFTKGFSLFMSELMFDKYHLLPQTQSNYLITTLNPVLHEESFENLKDEMLDRKAASLLRMLYHVIPDGAFMNASKSFLKKFAYKSATSDDLWDTFTNHLSTNLSVAEFMDTWTNRLGYPVINVDVDYKSRSVNVRQKKCCENSSAIENWPIPLTYALSPDFNVNKHLWLTNESTHIKPALDIKNNTGVLFNMNQTGFYRVNYNLQNWQLLQEQLQLNFRAIPVNNRAQILNDALELATLDQLDYNIALNLTKYLATEEEYIPWAAGFQGLEDVRIVLANTHYQEVFKKYILNLTQKTHENLGFENRESDSNTDTLLRSLILHNLCDVQQESCIYWAKRLYERWMKNSSESIPYAFRKIVECAALNAGNQKEWEFLWRHTLSENTTASDLETAYFSLGCSRQSWMINKYLELSLQGEIPMQYIPQVWKSLTHPVAINSGFKFLRTNWKRIKSAYYNNPFVLKAIVEDFLSRLSTTVDLEDLTTFYKNEESSMRNLAPMLLKAVHKIKFRIRWSSKYLTKVIEWMKNNVVY